MYISKKHMHYDGNASSSQCFVSDKNLKSIIEKGAQEVSDAEWFTKRIMNRLPEKHVRPRMSLAEKFCYAASIVILISGWLATVIHACRFGLTPLTIALAAIIPSIALFCILTVVAPALRRTIGELWP